MKKLIFFLLLLLIPFTSFVRALSSDIHLENLSIEGHEITPAFHKLNNIYTLIIDDDINSVIVNAIPVDDNHIIRIYNNDDLRLGQNVISIIIENEEGTKRNTYEIIVTINSEDSTPVFGDGYANSIRSVGLPEISIIVLGAFIIIMYSFRILLIRNS